MARKLDADGVRVFAEGLRTEEFSLYLREEDSLLRILREKREAALQLTPELNAWFGEQSPERS